MYKILLALGGIAGLIGIWIWIDRKNIEFMGPILIRRTQRGVKLLKKIATRYKKVWRTFGLVSIPIGLIFLCFIFFQLFQSSYTILTRPDAPPGAGPLIPWKYEGGWGFKIPGTGIFIPLWYGLIALSTVAFFHELAHGLVAKAEEMRIKSLAFVLFLIVPGAGVELDDEQIEKAKIKKRLGIFSAGPVSNIAVSAFVLLIISVLVSFFITSTGSVVLVNTTKGYPAENLTLGLTIFKINGIQADEFNLSLKPGDKMVLETDNGTFKFTTVPDPEDPKRGIIGVQIVKLPKFDSPIQVLRKVGLLGLLRSPWYRASDKVWVLFNSLKWIATLNFGIGLINLLPLEPLDGGKIFKTIVSPIKSKRKRELLIRIVFSLSLTLILFNMVGPYLV